MRHMRERLGSERDTGRRVMGVLVMRSLATIPEPNHGRTRWA
jgi:hypothetical protein